MEKYVVTFNNKRNLLDDYEVIEGKTAKDALKKAYGKEYNRLTGDSARYADIILIKGEMRGNNIVYKGRYTQLCFGEVV